MTGRPLLDVSGLSVVYRRRRRTVTAVDRVGFDVLPGETLGLVGESGSGKSSIVNAIVGFAPVATGVVRFDGEDVTRLAFAQRRAFYRRVQAVFQDPYSSLNPARTIGATLTESLQAGGVGHDRKETAQRVGAMLERVGLPADAAARYPPEFSGGQRQRIAIARALMPSPELVICDEPTSALDLSIQAQVLNLLQDLQATDGLSYLFVSHDLELIRHMCDRIVVLYAGQVMERGPAEVVLTMPSHPYTFALQRAAPVPNPELQRERREEARRMRRPRAEASAVAGDCCPFAGRCSYAQPRCFSERPTLRRISDGDVEVACHRFPEWRAEIGQQSRPRDGASDQSVHA